MTMSEYFITMTHPLKLLVAFIQVHDSFLCKNSRELGAKITNLRKICQISNVVHGLTGGKFPIGYQIQRLRKIKNIVVVIRFKEAKKGQRNV